jgi:hypothetical protein
MRSGKSGWFNFLEFIGIIALLSRSNEGRHAGSKASFIGASLSIYKVFLSIASLSGFLK